jgi:uncharacterized protein YbjT (DUF2867 family)
MNLLILGGTMFLGHHPVDTVLAAWHGQRETRP